MTEGDGLPNFVTAENGRERYFTKKALAALRDVAVIIHESDKNVSSLMELAQFRDLVRRCIADLHAVSLDLSARDIDHVQVEFRKSIQAKLSQVPRAFTHYFPSWTLGMETERHFVLGPVTFMTIEQWIESVEFDTDTLQRFLNTPDENAKWKESLRQILGRHRSNLREEASAHVSLASSVYAALSDCPSVLRVAVSGYEYHLSRKVGEMICKSALDAVSLLFGARDYFYQQALGHERLPPLRTSSIVEMDGYLLLPGSARGPRLRIVSYPSVRDYLSNNASSLDALSAILRALLEPSAARHPNLAKRWTSALDWFAEGQRERNDAVALAKIGTSLDVLSCGGKFRGILEMLAHLLSLNDATVIVSGRLPLTLAQVVRNVYERGRSQILHGTEFDRIKSFETTRNHAATLARLALLEAAQRLQKYVGGDGDKAFRCMPS